MNEIAMPNCNFSPERLVIGPEDQNATETAAVIRVEFEQSIPDRFEKNGSQVWLNWIRFRMTKPSSF